ncbi:MAG: extracellular solute-binding protein [Planctomycetes bacterium]|nr:extracellular solute-binding protein [Planctomycetota bacterium]
MPTCGSSPTLSSLCSASSNSASSQRARQQRGPLSCQLLAALILAACGVGLSGCGTAEKETKGADPAKAADSHAPVTAEMGGPGFTGEGWLTATPGPLGDPKAKPGGELVSEFPAWPDTLRPYGIGANMQTNQIVAGMCYETLCGMHPQTLETIPALASHWWISEDKMKFRFRINPLAKWSDGQPVVAEDVVATYKLIMDPTLLEPNYQSTLSNLKEPKALSKYIVEVECKEKHWRNFLRIIGMKILPSHEIAGLTGKEFLRKYNFKYTATSGPYIVRPEDIRKNESLAVTRRKDYWGDALEMNHGLFNFKRIRFVIILGDRLPFDKVCKGDIDFYLVNTAKWWVEEVVGLDGATKNTSPLKSPLKQVRLGQLVAQKIFTHVPEGFQGDAFNMRNPPLTDRRVRLALAHLFDRKTLLTKFAYDEYAALKSYYPGSDYENPDNKLTEFDPKRAQELLTEAGYTQRDSDGVLMRNGERLSVTLTYDMDGFSKYYTAYQEACRKAGVEIKLNLIDLPAQSKAHQEKTFQFIGAGFTGELFPDPRELWYSKMANERGSDNLPGLQNKEVDKIIDTYDHAFELSERIKLLRQLDGVVFNEYPYMLQWYVPCQRIMWWNKFGMPETVLTKYGDWSDAYTTWWYDPEKAAKLEESRRTGEVITPMPPRELHPWPISPDKASPKSGE